MRQDRSECAGERGIAAQYKSDQRRPVSIVQELCESRGGRLGLSVLTSFLVSVDVIFFIEPCFGIGHSLSLICQLTSEDIKQHFTTTSKSGIEPGA